MFPSSGKKNMTLLSSFGAGSRLRALPFLALGFWIMASTATAQNANIYRISIDKQRDRERLIIYLSRPANAELESFASPARVVVGFRNLALGFNVREQAESIRSEYIKNIEIYQFGDFIQFVIFMGKSADIQMVGNATETVMIDFLSKYRVSAVEGAEPNQPAFSTVPSYSPPSQISSFDMTDPGYANIDARIRMEASRMAPGLTGPTALPPSASASAGIYVPPPSIAQPFGSAPAATPPPTSPAAGLPSRYGQTSSAPGQPVLLPSQSIPMTDARAYDRFGNVYYPVAQARNQGSVGTPKPMQTSPVSASMGPGGEPLVSVDFVDTELRDALKLIASAGNLNIVLSSDVYPPKTGETEQPKRLVNLTLKNIPAVTAFEMVLKSQGLWYVPSDNVLFVTTVRSIEKDYQQILTSVIQLQYADAMQIRDIIMRMRLDPMPESIDVYLAPGIVYPNTMMSSTTLQVGADPAQNAPVSNYGNTRRDIPGDQLTTGKPNRLVVRGSAGAIENVKRIVADLDKAPSQVMIEATVVEINVDNLQDIGLSQDQINPITGQVQHGAAGQHGQAAAVFDALLPPGEGGLSVFIGGNGQILSDDVDLLLKALIQEGKAKILNNPTIATVDGQPAIIEVGQDTPIITRDASLTNGVTTYDTQLGFRRIGMSLYVTPRVDDATGAITLAINPILSDVDSTLMTYNADGSLSVQTPVVNVREANTVVRVASGEKVYIGGLMREMDQMISTKVPLLGDMPVVGRFFRREKDIKVRQEVVIILTPHVLQDLPVRR